jgi:membrane fusion protein, multidrug efflux system
MKQNGKSWPFAAVAMGVTLYGCNVARGDEAETHPAPTAEVAIPADVAVLTPRPFDEWSSYSGLLEPVEEVQVRSLVVGEIIGVDFVAGALVQKGTSLFRVDPRPYQAAVAKAGADVEAAEANLRYASRELERAGHLVDERVIAKSQYEEAERVVQQARATLQASKAALKLAQFNLEHTHIRAPISGRVSKANVTAGNIVGGEADSQVLTSLIATTKVYASFAVDEAAFLEVVAPKRQAPLGVLLALANETEYGRRGAIEFIDNKLDAGSGTIKLRATFDNSDGELIPGMYARVRLEKRRNSSAMLVADGAIGRNQNRMFVLVLDESDRARYREVAVAGMHQGLRVVTDGLAAGERLIVAGIQRVRPGDLVAPNVVRM